VSNTGTGPWLALSVADSGPGIPREAQESIFERFGRLESSRGVPGSGLGLSIVSAIAEAHGGKVLLASAPGEGSTFTIWIPLIATLEPAAGTDARRPTDAPARQSDTHDAEYAGTRSS
jgi:two-component system OmpR family sensor kinase